MSNPLWRQVRQLPVVANAFMARSPTMAMRTCPHTAGRPEQGSANLRSRLSVPARGMRGILAPWRADRPVGADPGQCGLRLAAEPEPVRRPRHTAGGPAGPRPGVPRRRGGGRAARRAARARGAVARRQCRGRRGGDRVRPGGDAAVARQPGRRRRLSRLFPGQEVGQRRRAGGGDVPAAPARQRRAERRSPGGGADAGARPLSAACAVWPPAVRKPGGAGRAVRALRRAGVARAGARTWRWSPARCWPIRAPARCSAATACRCARAIRWCSSTWPPRCRSFASRGWAISTRARWPGGWSSSRRWWGGRCR